MKKLGNKLLVDLVVADQVVGSTFAVLPQTRRSTRGANKQQTSNSSNDYSTSNKIIIPKNIITLSTKNDSSSNIVTAKTRGRKKKIRLLDSADKDESYQNGQQFSLEDSENQRLSNKMETSSSDKALKITKISLGSRRVNESIDDESIPNEDYQFNEELDDQINEEEDFEEEYYSQSNNSNSLNFKLIRQSQNGNDSVNQYSEDYESNLGKKLTKRQKNILMKNQVITEEVNDFEEPLLSLPERRRKVRKNKKVLTEEEQIKKLQMEEKRKQQFKKMNEEKRQQVVDQILNEHGRQKIKRNKEELKKDMEKQAHKFRQLPENDIKIKYISTSQGQQLVLDKKLAGVNILKPIDIQDEKIQYNIIAHAAALNNNGFSNHQNSYIYSPNVTQIHSTNTNGSNDVITNTTIYSNEQLTKKIEEQKKIMCSQCKKQQFKYKIPKTQFVACSLECFKLLKI
eukprot:TRINITY_DN7712_c0_g1_i6.p1 TRINITY_DN7712_c0_g1~~TRINITY_DN7712_c0_g1_i6.p1  ORF type:complete len:456 (-),score=72.18 TRINITY_DN7712_c0_g1_i6:60-1427(-)